MPAEVYEVVAQGARYWFLFLMALIAWRSYRWYRRDRRQDKKRRKLLPDAGHIGEMVVMEGGGVFERGEVMPVPFEGTLGALRTNDLCVPVEGVAKKHLWFRFDKGVGLMVEPFGKNAVEVDGEPFVSRREPLYMAHGSRLYVGEAELRLRLFAGFEATARAPQGPAFAADASPGAPQPDDAQQQAMQQWMAQQQAAMQQWMYEQEMERRRAYEQWMAQQRAAAAQPPAEADDPDDEYDEPPQDAFAPIDAPVDPTAYMRPRSEATPVRDPMPAAEEPVFYAPVTDEEDDWPMEIDDADEDMTDAAAPPKSAYVGRDEAAQAKRVLWDRYFGGGAEE